MVGAAYGVLTLRDRQRRSRLGTAWEEGRRPNRADMHNWTGWVPLTLGCLLLLGQVFVRQNFSRLPADAQTFLLAAWNWVKFGLIVSVWLLVVLFILSVLVTLVFLAIGKRKDSRFRVIEALTHEGKVLPAIATVHEILDRPGNDGTNVISLAALNHLSALEGMRGAWTETLKLIERLELLTRSQSLFVGLKGLALWKVGRLDDAESCLRARVALQSDDPVGLVGLGLFLAEVGNRDEAIQILHLIDCQLAQRAQVRVKSSHEVIQEYLRQTIHGRANGSQQDVDVCDVACAAGMRELLLAHVVDVEFVNSQPIEIVLPTWLLIPMRTAKKPGRDDSLPS